MSLKCIGIDIGHNLRCDIGAVGIRREDELNLLVGKALISKFRRVYRSLGGGNVYLLQQVVIEIH